MTPRQKQALDYISAELDRTGGVPPTFEAVRAHLGLRSKSAVHRLVTALQDRGYLEREAGRAQTLRLRSPDLTRASDAALLAEITRRCLREVRHA